MPWDSLSVMRLTQIHWSPAVVWASPLGIVTVATVPAVSCPRKGCLGSLRAGQEEPGARSPCFYVVVPTLLPARAAGNTGPLRGPAWCRLHHSRRSLTGGGEHGLRLRCHTSQVTLGNSGPRGHQARSRAIAAWSGSVVWLKGGCGASWVSVLFDSTLGYPGEVPKKAQGRLKVGEPLM